MLRRDRALTTSPSLSESMHLPKSLAGTSWSPITKASCEWSWAHSPSLLAVGIHSPAVPAVLASSVSTCVHDLVVF